MSENCDHHCGSYGSDCASRKSANLFILANENSRIGKVIAVVSGKGGVGKSMVTSAMAVLMRRKGYETLEKR